MRRLAATLAALVVAATPAAARAQTTHPDFSGKWALDTTKLDPQMQQLGVTNATMTITQDAKTLKEDQNMSSSMGSQAVTVSYNMDSTEAHNTVSQGPLTMDMASTTSWDGPTMVITTKSDIQGNPYTRTDRYSLDATGKVLTIETSISVMGQSLNLKQVFNKA